MKMICDKSYTGRTVDPIQRRIINIVVKISRRKLKMETSKTSAHKVTDQNAFDDAMKFGILDVVNPTNEFIWVHLLITFNAYL